MPSPDICLCITRTTDLTAALAVKDLVSLYEVRIDLIGDAWPEVAASLPHPWIACNRLAAQGGGRDAPEEVRLDALLRAVELGAATVDIEVETPDVCSFITAVKGRATVLVSHHDLVKTDTEEALVGVVERQRSTGADICKLVTTATSVEDNVTVLRIVRRYAATGIVAFAMGPLGMTSRVLAPLAGARFTYASLAAGHESAPGQLTVDQLRAMYSSMGVT